jgi:hypothetical protein
MRLPLRQLLMAFRTSVAVALNGSAKVFPSPIDDPPLSMLDTPIWKYPAADESTLMMYEAGNPRRGDFMV